jgi:uncharacterized protein (DUF2236 family)
VTGGTYPFFTVNLLERRLDLLAQHIDDMHKAVRATNVSGRSYRFWVVLLCMTNNQGLIEKIVLDEIEGKYRAIHGYDGIVWKIYGGFLTLLFAGWATLLTSIVEDKAAHPSITNLSRGGCSCSASGSHSALGM